MSNKKSKKYEDKEYVSVVEEITNLIITAYLSSKAYKKLKQGITSISFELTYNERKKLNKAILNTVELTFDSNSKILERNINNAWRIFQEGGEPADFVNKAKEVIKPLARTSVKKSVKQLNKFKLKTTTESQRIAKQGVAKVLKEYSSNGGSIDKAIDKTRNKMLNDGIKSVHFKNGRKMNIDAYNRMNERTIQRELRNDISDRIAIREDLFIFQISQHAGARDMCYKVQGELFTKNGKSGSFIGMDGVKYEYVPLDDIENYGEPAGIFGINCRHYYTPVNPEYFVDRVTKHIQSPTANANERKRQANNRARANRRSLKKIYGKRNRN